MSYETLIVETHGRVGLITLNRPQALNALNDQLTGELDEALAAFDADRNIGCMVLTGSAKAFAAGADIKEMQARQFPATFIDEFLNWGAIAKKRKPIVAAVAGYALGGGCEIAMMCDVIIAADTAKFGQPEIKLGVTPGAGGTQRLARLVGRAKAMDLCLTGRLMDAAEAERAGLVSRVVPAAELLTVALDDRRDHRRHAAGGGAGGQGVRQAGRRGVAGGGAAVRAAGVPLDVRHLRPEGRHGRLRREASGQVREPLTRPLARRGRAAGGAPDRLDQQLKAAGVRRARRMT